LCPPAPEAAFRETVNYLIQAAGYGDKKFCPRKGARRTQKKAEERFRAFSRFSRANKIKFS
jgi:hypothetical protein